MTVGQMKNDLLTEILTCDSTRLRDPEFVKRLFIGQPGSLADSASLQVLQVRNLADQASLVQSSGRLARMNVVLTAIIAVATAVNVWINWQNIGGTP